MELRDLIGALEAPMLMGADNVDITNIQSDSRRVTKGSLFVAVRGTAVDGHAYMDSAIEKGAVAIVCEEAPSYLEGRCSFIVVKDSAEALGLLVSRWYGDPSRKLVLVGVTGTNGKTTIATLLYEMFRKMGHKVGLLSTVCNYIDGEAVPTDHTTPDPLTLHSLMARMVEAGCEYAFMEVSSHSIDQRRISGLSFDGGIFTNLTRDHLDYHKTVENYLKAKKKFFDDLPAGTFALTNADDKNGLVMLQNTRAHRYTYSCRTMADFTAKVIEKHLDGTLLRLDGEEVWTKFTGDFNAYNLLAVYAAARLLGFPKENVLEYVSLLVPVSGRFETLISTEGVMAVVDYAHTPDAVENVLSTICGLKGRDNQVITVVGAGGDRDKTKRPEMADAACRYSDHVILTSDNPRSEDPEQIIRDMLTGVKEGFQYRVEAITDRKEAIRKAIGMASKGDIILVAGKGHENYQEVKGVKHHFDDKEVIREIFDLSNR